jgi:hypothetical protein
LNTLDKFPQLGAQQVSEMCANAALHAQNFVGTPKLQNMNAAKRLVPILFRKMLMRIDLASHDDQWAYFDALQTCVG